MTSTIKNFLEKNYILLDSDPRDFCMTAYNGLTLIEQSIVFEMLKDAGIDITKARTDTLRFIIGMSLAEVIQKVSLEIYVARYLTGILGYDDVDIREFILNNLMEWDNDIVLEGNDYYIYPRV